MARLKEKYSFNREINGTRIRNEKIILPVTEKGLPDYDHMSNHMRCLEKQKLNRYQMYWRHTRYRADYR